MRKLSLLALLLVFVSCLNLYAEQELSAFEQWQAKPSAITAGKAFADALNNRSIQQLEQIINSDELLRRAFNLMGNPSGSRDMMRGAKKGLSVNLFQAWFMALERSNGVARYRRLIDIDGQSRALVMLDLGDNGINFFELILDPKEPGVVDFYTHGSGERASQTLAKVFGMVMPESTNFLKRLLDIKDVNKEVGEAFKAVSLLNRQGKFEQAYKKLKALPKDISDSRIISIMLVVNSSSLDESIYRKELENLERLHGDQEDLFLILMDHYFYTEQYEKGLKGLHKLNRRLGTDAAIVNMISVFHFLNKDFEKALQQINKAINLENYNEDHYWFKADILNARGEFAKVVDVFKFIEDEFDVYIDPEELKLIEGYEKFVESDAFKNWQAEQA